jgi:hypothetical protein
LDHTNTAGTSVYLSSSSPLQQQNCWRPCPHGRINKIVYTCPFPAGLKDRLYIFHQLLNIAGFLCVDTVRVPKPHVLLSPAHNHQNRLGEDSVWSDYVNLTWAMNGQPALLDDLGHGNRHSSSSSSSSSSSPPPLFWHTIEPEQTLTDFHSVIAHSLEHPDRPFLWQMDAYWWMSSLQHQRDWRIFLNQNNGTTTTLALLRTAFPTNQPFGDNDNDNNRTTTATSSNGCVYYQERDPDHLIAIATRLWDQELEPLLTSTNTNTTTTTKSVIGFFHLRRGDGIPECNTTLAKLRSYLNCSLHGSSQVLGNITLLLGTDEQDANYLRDLQQLFTIEFPHVRLVMNLNDLAWRYVREAVERGILPKRFLNNYYIFRLEDRIRRHPTIAVRLSQRRNIACNNCDPVI